MSGGNAGGYGGPLVALDRFPGAPTVLEGWSGRAAVAEACCRRRCGGPTTSRGGAGAGSLDGGRAVVLRLLEARGSPLGGAVGLSGA